MNGASIETSEFDAGLNLWTVRVGRVTAHGIAPEGLRPTSWTVASRTGRVMETVQDAGEVRSLPLVGRRALAKALRAVAEGRI